MYLWLELSNLDYFKEAGWSTKYTSDSLEIIKYGNLSFKLLLNLEKKIDLSFKILPFSFSSRGDSYKYKIK